MLKFVKKEHRGCVAHIAEIEDGYFYQISSGRFNKFEVAICRGKQENNFTPLEREPLKGFETVGECKKHAREHYLKRRGDLKRKAISEERQQGRTAGCLVEPYWRPWKED